MNKKHSQNGIAVIGVVVLVIIVAIVAGSGYLVFGKKSSDYYELVRTDPSYRVFWGKEDKLDMPVDLDQLFKIFEELEPGSSLKLQKIMDEVDQSKMKVKSTKEFRMLFRLLWSILFNTINEGYRMEETKQRIDTEGLKQDFNQKISWLQHGVMK